MHVRTSIVFLVYPDQEHHVLQANKWEHWTDDMWNMWNMQLVTPDMLRKLFDQLWSVSIAAD